MGFMTRRNLQRRAVKTAPRVSCETKVETAVKPVVKAVEETVVEPKEELTRKEVNSMPYFKVKSVAQANGIDVENKKTSELRVEVIEKLGL